MCGAPTPASPRPAARQTSLPSSSSLSAATHQPGLQKSSSRSQKASRDRLPAPPRPAPRAPRSISHSLARPPPRSRPAPRCAGTFPAARTSPSSVSDLPSPSCTAPSFPQSHFRSPRSEAMPAAFVFSRSRRCCWLFVRVARDSHQLTLLGGGCGIHLIRFQGLRRRIPRLACAIFSYPAAGLKDGAAETGRRSRIAPLRGPGAAAWRPPG